MREFERALVNKLRTISALVTKTAYTPSRLSIAVVEPKQKVLIPGCFVDVDAQPLGGTDSSAVKQSEVSFYLIGKRRGDVLAMAATLESEFRDSNNCEKKFDISDGSVYCIGSYWTNMDAPRWSDAEDCYEMVVRAIIKWSPK